MIQREPAWRVLLEEITSSTVEIPPEGEKAAGYLLSPLGARMNRVLVAGSLDPAESVGKDPAQPFYRARITDATTSVFVTAGSYHPKALRTLQQLKEPHAAIVLGKTHLYRGKNDVPYVSLRAETIRFVTPDVAAAVTAEAIDGTLERIDRIARLHAGIPDRASDPSATFSGAWTVAAQDALRRYPGDPTPRFREVVGRALRVLDPEHAPVSPPLPARPPTPGPVAPPSPVRALPARTPSPAPPPAAAPRPSRNRPPLDAAESASFLDLIDELAEGADDGYADLRELTQRSKLRGVTDERVEEIVNRLEEDGTIEEPIVGKLRRA